MMTLQDIGTLLRAQRKQQGLSLSALAERSHIHRNTLSALERGLGNVEVNTLLAICEQLGLVLSFHPKHFAPTVNTASAYLPFVGSLATILEDGATPRSSTPTSLQKRIAHRLQAAEPGKERREPAMPETADPAGALPSSDAQGQRIPLLQRLSSVPDEAQASRPTALQRRIQARLTPSVQTKKGKQ
jgi:transcriptional regulator with XRE-family HTH domain